jgi:uncharacterized membrane protein YesL
MISMIGFFVRKAFYDGWDNLLALMTVNIVMLAVGFCGFFLAGLVSRFVPLSVAIALACAVAEGILLMACSKSMSRIASYKPFSFKEFGVAFRETWLHGALFAGLVSVGLLVMAVAIPYYLSIGGPIGVGCALVLFWVAVICVLSLQWFMPIRSQLEKGFAPSLKKSFAFFFDNPGFSVFMFAYSLVLLALSLLVVMILPSFAGISLAQNEAFRLRMYKYDWMEKHPELDWREARKRIPWDELIAGDYETVGHRSLKSFIFPWMD